jgi:hypothetical protein
MDMARSKRRSNKRDWRQIAFFVFNFIVVLSMALGYVLLVVSRQ